MTRSHLTLVVKPGARNELLTLLDRLEVVAAVQDQPGSSPPPYSDRIDDPDEVKSGARADNRPVLREVLGALRRGEAEAVVVAKLDRLSL